MVTFKKRMKCLFPLLLAMLQAVLPVTVSAYTQPVSTIAGGGGSTSSPAYSNLGVIGQPGIVGASASTSFRADHGFLPVLGGWRILYPVISATPGILTFTLVGDSSDSQSVAVANAGGSVLKWSVAKSNGSESYFTFTPASGTGNASVTVTANAAGLAAGTYNDTLTVSGTGISRTVQVQLTLTVSATGNRLTMTVVSDTPQKGGGSVHSDPTGISCYGAGSDPAGMSGTCSADFSPGSTVTLMQTPDSNSTWATWSAAGCGTNQSCQVVMNGAKNVTATFPYAYMARVNSSGNRFDTLVEALSGAAATDTILAREVTFSGDLTLAGKFITLMGGLSAWYLPQNAWTTLNGKLILQSGSLTVDRLVVE
jgi:hypothetical protein